MPTDERSPPVMFLKVKPNTKTDQEKLSKALRTLECEDPSFHVLVDPESGETNLGGKGELHLDSKIERLKTEYGIAINAGSLQVAYLEVLTTAVEVDYTHEKQIGDTRQFARVKLSLEPNERGTGNAFKADIVGDDVPTEFIRAVEKAVEQVWDQGVLVGFPLVDMTVTVVEGACHKDHSSSIAFEIAARAAMKEACKRGGVRLLEPVMDVEILVPGEFVTRVVSEVDSRRGRVTLLEMRGAETVIRAIVPLAMMFGFNSVIVAMSGVPSIPWDMNFIDYEDAPSNSSGNDPDNFPPAVGMRA
jgi:elongation factor G